MRPFRATSAILVTIFSILFLLGTLSGDAFGESSKRPQAHSKIRRADRKRIVRWLRAVQAVNEKEVAGLSVLPMVVQVEMLSKDYDKDLCGRPTKLTIETDTGVSLRCVSNAIGWARDFYKSALRVNSNYSYPWAEALIGREGLLKAGYLSSDRIVSTAFNKSETSYETFFILTKHGRIRGFFVTMFE